ncbi:MAG: right-handed parallel beta-helix repeat-containing protein [Limisphaerales bacterium]
MPAEIVGEATWSGTNLIAGTVTVESNAVLRISPGARILLDAAATLVVRGQLIAEGTADEPIFFTRVSVGQRWKGIRLIKAQPSRFSHCTFEYVESAGTHLDYYDNDCDETTTPPNRNYHEAIVALACDVIFEDCLFQNLPDSTGSREGDAIAIISDDPQNPGAASANINRCRFISIGQGIHSRFSYILVENSFFTDHHGDNDDIDMYGESIPVPMIRNNVFLNPAHDDMINPTRCSAIIMGNVISGGDDHGIVLRDKCSPIVVNNFISNIANGGISVQNQCDALIVNNTIVNCGRGIRLFDHTDRRNPPYCLFPGSGRATVVNTIIRDCNESFTLTESPYPLDLGSHVTVAFSNIEGGQASASVSANSTLTWAEGNRDIDPQFATDLFLSANSPMIDAGTNRFGGFFSNAPLDGNGDGIAQVDIGAHEFLLAGADSNNDGIPDGWTAQYGFYPGLTNIATSDLDSDQFTLLQEWVAGTNPTNSASLLRLATTPDRSLFEFPASAEREFTVQFTTNLLSPWTDLTATSSGTVQLALTNSSGFYRARARLP